MTTTKRALIVVDVQNDFITGSLPVPDAEDVASNIKDLLHCGLDGEADHDVIVTTQDWHIDPGDHWAAPDTEPDFDTTWPVHCKAGTAGAELHAHIKNLRVDSRFYKGQYKAAFSGFEGVNDDGEYLEAFLRRAGVTEVDVVGVATDYCVKATALDSVKIGFTTRVLLPYTAAVSGAGLGKAVDELKDAGVIVE